MGEHIKLFSGHTDYEDYMGGGVALPNVSHCIEENEVHYTPIPHYAKLYNGNEVVSTAELCYDNNGDSSVLYDFYHSCGGNYDIALYTWNGEEWGDFDAVEVDLFKGASNVNVVGGEGSSANAQFTVSRNGNVLRIESTEGKWNAFFFTFHISYINDKGEEAQSLVMINYND